MTVSFSSLLFFIHLARLTALGKAEWSTEGRIGLRLFTDSATTHFDQPMENGLEIFESPYYNRSRPLLVLIHGMDASVNCEFVEASVEAIYFRGWNLQYNVIALNLPELLAKQDVRDMYLYTTAKNSQLAGDAIGEFFKEVIRLQYVSPDSLYVVGYSMGAQVAGYMGRKIKETYGPVEYIMGLDPAGIGFRPSTFAAWFTQLTHVSADDAKYTHFVHCNSRGWGSTMRHATANFIFNGGNMQPGCLGNINVACSHNRVPYYFIESILYPDSFLAQRCDSWERFSDCQCSSEDVRYLRFPPDLEASGLYYLRTNGKTKFGKGKKGIACITEEKAVIQKKKHTVNHHHKRKTAKHRTSRHEYIKSHAVDMRNIDRIYNGINE